MQHWQTLKTSNYPFDKIKTVIKKQYNHETGEYEKISYKNIAVVMDTETTSTIIDGRKVGWMYIWMVRIAGVTYYGRTWDDYKEFIEILEEKSKCDTHNRYVVYIHNLPFDFSFFKKVIHFDECFATDKNKCIKAVSGGIEYRDSYILTQQSLDSIGGDLGIPKLKGYLDYNKTRTFETPMKPKELMYCNYDVIILEKKITKLIEDEGNITKIPLTKTGYVRREMRKACNNNEYRKFFRLLMSKLTMTAGEYNYCKLVFAGGFTHANSKYVGKVMTNVASQDETSAYPAMCVSKKFPMGKPKKIKKIQNMREYLELYKDHCIMQTLYLTGVHIKKDAPDTYISRHKCANVTKAVLDNGRIVSAETLTYPCTDQDLFIILKLYNIESIHMEDIYVYKKDYLPTPIIESILKFYEIKTTLKGIDEQIEEYNRYKAWLNSTYGMMVTDIVHDIIILLDNGEWASEKADISKSIETYNESKNRVLYYPWGVWITAYNRAAIWTAIFAVGEDYLYTDTDSVKYINKEKHEEFFKKYNEKIQKEVEVCLRYRGIDPAKATPENIHGKKCPIGVFEYEGTYKKFKTLGAKRYMVINPKKNRLEITVAGLGKKAGCDYIKEQARIRRKMGEKIDVFDLFDHKMVVPANHTGKLAHTYIDDKWEGYVTDYLGNTVYVITQSGCHLEPVDFSLDMDHDGWLEYLRGFQCME